jgi:hypothetical protein
MVDFVVWKFDGLFFDVLLFSLVLSWIIVVD